MKKIFTLLVALGALSSAFAQRSYDNGRGNNQPTQNSNYGQAGNAGDSYNNPSQRGVQQPGNAGGSYNNGSSRGVQQNGEWNNGNQPRQNDYARNDRYNRRGNNDNGHFNNRDRVAMSRRGNDRGRNYYRNDHFSRDRYYDRCDYRYDRRR